MHPRSASRYLIFLAILGSLIAARVYGKDLLIACVLGYVFDPNGGPVAGADLDFDNAITGERLLTPGDNTNMSGFYTVCVPNGVYNISYAPPPGSHLLGQWRYNESLFNSNPQIDITLDFGKVLWGTVRSPDGLGIGMVDLDADNISTGVRIFTPNDNSADTTGAFWIVVPSGDYRIRFQHLLSGSRWRPLQIDSLAVFADTELNVILSSGMFFSGYVTDTNGQAIENISVDFRNMNTGEKIYLGANKTDTAGFYNIVVPTGLFQLRYVPPPGSRYIGLAIDSVAIDTDLVRDQTLQSGWLISSFVHDSTGNPLELADLDIIQESTGIKLFTPNDKTDSLGMATISLLPDTYTIRVQPPPGSIYDRLVVTGAAINSDTSFDFTLPEVPKVNLSGRITDSSGAGLPNIELNFSDTLTGSKVFIPDNLTDSSGYYHVFAPIGSFDIVFSPPRGSGYVGADLGTVLIVQDTIWDDIVLERGYIFSALVVNLAGMPLENIDLDFISESSGNTIFTPHDNTDIFGTADVTVPRDIYSIDLTPTQGSAFDQRRLTGFQITSDTSITLFLFKTGSALPGDFDLKQNYPNPFNGITTISYNLFIAGDVSIIIYNVLGQRVRTFYPGVQPPGNYLTPWDGTDNNGQPVASGLYFYKLRASRESKTHNMILVR